MNLKELAQQADISVKAATKLFEELAKAARAGHNVVVREFGSFSMALHKAKEGEAPSAAESAQLRFKAHPTHRSVPAKDVNWELAKADKAQKIAQRANKTSQAPKEKKKPAAK